MVELLDPEQPKPPGLKVAEQGQLVVVPLGPLFEQCNPKRREWPQKLP
jgi:hypothetical protein